MDLKTSKQLQQKGSDKKCFNKIEKDTHMMKCHLQTFDMDNN